LVPNVRGDEDVVGPLRVKKRWLVALVRGVTVATRFENARLPVLGLMPRCPCTIPALRKSFGETRAKLLNRPEAKSRELTAVTPFMTRALRYVLYTLKLFTTVVRPAKKPPRP
jgi:hypothetical protein